MEQSPATRQSLIVKLRDPADSGAWSEFVALYEPLVYRLARRKGLQDADAKDICQEVFRAVAGAVDRWDPDRGSFRGWISRIARNLLINFLTRGSQHFRGSGATSVQELLEAHPAEDPWATALFDHEYKRQLFQLAAAAVKGEFTPATWQAFWQTVVEDRQPKAVAAELGLSLGSVYVARSRVLARIRRRVQGLAQDSAEVTSEVHHGIPIDRM
jgi:RNA polymerase sigma-70 factor (ECF subfamily)